MSERPEDVLFTYITDKREGFVNRAEARKALTALAAERDALITERDGLQVEVNRAGSQVIRLANERTKADQHRAQMGRAYDAREAELARLREALGEAVERKTSTGVWWHHEAVRNFARDILAALTDTEGPETDA